MVLSFNWYNGIGLSPYFLEHAREMKINLGNREVENLRVKLHVQLSEANPREMSFGLSTQQVQEMKIPL